MVRIRHYVSVLFALLLNFVLLLTIASGTVFAHAKVDSATPGIGSVINTAPTSISVHTLENIKPGAQFSNLFVYGPDGSLISQGNATIPLSKPNVMSVGIKPEKDGVYVVRWVTVSADDGDPDQGAFIFTVKSAAGSTTNASAPVSNTAKVAPAPTTSSFPTIPVVITGLIALLIGLSAGFGIGRNRAASPTSKTIAEDVNSINSDRVSR